MDTLKVLFEKIDNTLVDKFKCKFTSMTTTKLDFVWNLISTFIDIHDDVSDDQKVLLHNAVDSTSLCSEESRFFHKIIDYEMSTDKYIITINDMFMKNTKLQKCQLGNAIKKCIIWSTKLNFES